MNRGAFSVARAAEQRGGVVVLFGLLLPVMLLALALAIDVGNWFVHKRHLQMQADAAALAGGAYFGNCFTGDPNADATIQSTATRYAGNSSSTYNLQIGGGASRVTTLYNSKTFASGGPGADDTETNGPCETPHLMFDVKQTETGVPYILGSLIDAVVPGPSTVVPAINARARVQLKTVKILSGSLPLAVPDVNPKHVAVTFINESTGASLGMFPLTKGAASGGLNYWSGSANVTLPATTTSLKVGARVSVGGVDGNCTGTAAGVGFVCYDNSATGIGLVAVRDYATTVGTLTSPRIQAVWAVSRAACSLTTPSPFFSDATLAGAGSCPMDVYARVSAGASYATGTLTATINGITRTLVAPATAGGDWTTPTGSPFTIPANRGPYNVDLNWKCPSGCGSKGIDFPAVQRVYSGTDQDSGPVKWMDISEGGTRIYSGTPGAHTFAVTVGIEGSLNLSTSAQTTALRLTGGSRTTAIDCDGTGAAAWKAAIVGGCQTPYQLNASGLCPDPSPPSGPADCVPVEPGKMANTAASALNQRFASCPANNWPGPLATSDPRIVKLMVTDFSALDGSGKTTVPVINFAAFYITGWDGASCANNQPYPFPGSSNKGDIWGHFIKYVAPDPFSGGTDGCDPNAVTPCIPVLVK
jgi:hypothetical protein